MSLPAKRRVAARVYVGQIGQAARADYCAADFTDAVRWILHAISRITIPVGFAFVNSLEAQQIQFGANIALYLPRGKLLDRGCRQMAPLPPNHAHLLRQHRLLRLFSNGLEVRLHLVAAVLVIFVFQRESAGVFPARPALRWLAAFPYGWKSRTPPAAKYSAAAGKRKIPEHF